MKPNTIGISWQKRSRKWLVRIWAYNKSWWVGLFADREEAQKIKKLVKEKLKLPHDEWLSWYNAYRESLPKSPKAFQDLTGQKFGRLTTLRWEKVGRRTYWHCKCDCGKEVRIIKEGLTRRPHVSCGCYQREKTALTVTGFITQDKNSRKWLVRVWAHKKTWRIGLFADMEEAQEIKRLAEEKLKLPHDEWLSWFNAFKESLPKSPKVFQDLTGQKFDRLTALRPKRTGRHTYWHCKCDCGKEIMVRQDMLKKKPQASCGCHQRAELARIARIRFGFIDGTCVSNIRSDKLRSDNISGIRGVSWYSRIQKWNAKITFKGKPYHLGIFADIQDAAQIRKKAEEKIFGPFLEWYENHKKQLDKPE